MPDIRGIEQFLADLDERARPAAPARNRVIQKLVTVSGDLIVISDSTGLTVTSSTLYLWASSTALPPTANQLAWSMGEWAVTT